MDFESDKSDVGKIRHIFNTDKFTRQGLDVIFNDTIKYTFDVGDLVGVNKLYSDVYEHEIKEHSINKRANILDLEIDMVVSAITAKDPVNPDRVFEIIFEQDSPSTVSMLIYRTDKSKDGNFYDTIKGDYSFYPVKGAFDLKVTGNKTSEYNGVYIVSEGEWQRIEDTEDVVSDITYTVKCSAFSIENFLMIKLPYKSAPTVPIITPEIVDDVKMVEYFYLTDDVLLINLVRSNNTSIGYKEDPGSTSYNEKVDFLDRMPDFKIFFDKHTIKKKNIYGYEYQTLRSGIIGKINWKFAAAASIENVYTEKLNINEKYTIDGYSDLAKGDLVIVRKQEDNNENGIYSFDGEKLENINLPGEIVNSYFIIKNGSSRRKGRGLHIFGVSGICMSTQFTSENIDIKPVPEMIPKISSGIKKTVETVAAITPPKPTSLLLDEDLNEYLNMGLYGLGGLLAIFLTIKMVKPSNNNGGYNNGY